MKTTLKVLSNFGKWSNVKYMSSNAKTRMNTKKLIDDHKSGKIDIINPWMLDESK